MKPETRGSFLNRSFRRSFRKKKNTDKEKIISPEKQAEEEEKAFKEFRKAINDAIQPRYNEVRLRRFLKARDFNVSEAEKLMRLDIKFRKFLQLENLDGITIPEVIKYMNKTAILGVDKEGCLIRILRIGKIDLKGLVHSVSTFYLLSLLIRGLEADIKRLEEENKKNGKNGTQAIFIVDFDGLTTSQILHKPVLDSLMLFLRKFQDHYFGYWKRIYVINTPSYFPSVYKLIKPVMVEAFSSKVVICNTDLTVLLQDIDSDVLPDCIGGTKTDYMDNPQYAGLITEYAPVPVSYHAKREEFLNPNEPGVESLTVSAGGFVNVPIPVLVANSIIDFTICGKDNDIGIAIYYEPNVTVCHVEKYKKKVNPQDILSKLEQLTPDFRSQCHVKPETGKALAWRPGVYIMHFDNTYSWMNSKQIYYKIQVISPELDNQLPDTTAKFQEVQLH